MKKTLLLLFTALMGGVSVANATEKVDPGESLTYGTKVSLAGGWSGKYIELDGANSDKSAFDYVWIKYSAVSGGDVKFGITYNEWLKKESWGDSYYADNTLIIGESGVVGIAIEKTKTYTNGNAETDGLYKGDIYAKHVQQVFIQDQGSAAEVTVEGIYFGTEAEFNAAVAESPTVYGDKVIDLKGWGWGWSATGAVADGICTITLSSDNGAYSTGWNDAADWSMYKYLVAVVESYSSESDEPFLQIHAKGDNDTKVVAHEEIAKTFTEQQTFAIELDATYSGAVKQLWFQGKASGDVIKVSKLYLTNTNPTTGIQTVKAAGAQDGAIYNLAGQKVNENYKGIVIKNGRKYVQK